jgi:hypothetical protein
VLGVTAAGCVGVTQAQGVMQPGVALTAGAWDMLTHSHVLCGLQGVQEHATLCLRVQQVAA